jgi:hypothetical protein
MLLLLLLLLIGLRRTVEPSKQLPIVATLVAVCNLTYTAGREGCP